MQYIISSVLILLTFIIIYVLNYQLEYKKPAKVEDDPDKVNIKSDYIVILSKDSCPYCVQLHNEIKNTTKKYTTITLNNMNTYDFDDTYTNLGTEERNDILNEVGKIIQPSKSVMFPTIIVKDKVYYGLPQKKLLSDIFDTDIPDDTGAGTGI